MKHKRTRLGCGHSAVGIHDYTDTYRWVVRCRTCGRQEEWSQRQWRGTISTPPESMLLVHDEPRESVRLAASA